MNHKAIEFKAGSLNAMSAIVRELDNVRLADVLHAQMGGLGEFFNGEAAVIDLSQLKTAPERADWSGLQSLLRRYGLHAVAVRHAPEHLHDSARRAGLAILSQDFSPSKTPAPTAAPSPPTPPQPSAPASTAQGNTMIIERPLRSGQQVYARDSDVVILGGVSHGAEVIADGNIHCYGPLRGRALAGAQGNTQARIFTTSFGPELVSIAGVFRTFERGLPPNVAGKAAHTVLRTDAQNKQNLNIDPLQTS